MKNKIDTEIREEIAFDKAVIARQTAQMHRDNYTHHYAELQSEGAMHEAEQREEHKKWKESIYMNYLRFCADNPNFPTYDKKLTFAEFDSGEFGKWADLQESLDNCGYRG